MTASLISLQGAVLWHSATSLTGMPENGAMELHALQLPPLMSLVQINQTVLLRLKWSGPIDGTNDYWITQPMDAINWTDSNFYRTGVDAFANFSELARVPTFVRVDHVGWRPDPRGGTSVSVTVANAGSTVAPIVAISLTSQHGYPLQPAFCSANYFALLPSESRMLDCWLPWNAEAGNVTIESYDHAANF